MNFSVTERNSFKRCRRQAVLTSKNGQNLEPLQSPLAMSTGSLVHRAHQLWLLDAARVHGLREHTMCAASEILERLEANYLARVGCLPTDDEVATTYASTELALAMADNFEKRYGVPLPDEYTILQPEQKIRVPVPGTEHFLEGRLDGLIQHSSGRIDILERKTYDQRPQLGTLANNDQFLGYVWLVGQLNLQEQPAQVFYDGLWRRDHVPRGRTFEELFLRTVVTHNQHQLNEFTRHLPLELNYMAELYEHPDTAYKTVPFRGCPDCGVKRICDTMSRGEDTNAIISSAYVRRTDNEEIVEDVP